MVAAISITIIFCIHSFGSKPVSNELYDYYTSHYEADTNAHNMVTAIYLNYRFPDTIFETLTLLVSVIGIIYFSRHSLGGD